MRDNRKGAAAIYFFSSGHFLEVVKIIKNPYGTGIEGDKTKKCTFRCNFKRMKKIALIILALGLLMSCKKKNKEDDNTDTVTPAVATTQPVSPPIRIPADADGLLYAYRTQKSASYSTYVGDATAFFYTAPGNYVLVDAGTVKCNDSVLVKQSSGSYLYYGKVVGAQPYSGIDYSAGYSWTVTGTANVPGFTFSNATFPTNAALTSGTLITKSTTYTCTFTPPLNADSVVVTFVCDSVQQKKTVAASSGSCTFSAAEVDAVKKAGSTNFPYIHLLSYRILPNPVSTKKYYLVGSTTASFRCNIN
jgi:hypothetical protein